MRLIPSHSKRLNTPLFAMYKIIYMLYIYSYPHTSLYISYTIVYIIYMTKYKPKRAVSFRASEEIYKQLKSIAIKEKKKVSAICEGILWEGIAALKRTEKIIN